MQKRPVINTTKLQVYESISECARSLGTRPSAIIESIMLARPYKGNRIEYLDCFNKMPRYNRESAIIWSYYNARN